MRTLLFHTSEDIFIGEEQGIITHIEIPRELLLSEQQHDMIVREILRSCTKDVIVLEDRPSGSHISVLGIPTGVPCSLPVWPLHSRSGLFVLAFTAFDKATGEWYVYPNT